MHAVFGSSDRVQPLFWNEKGEIPLVESGVKAPLAIKCYIESYCWAEFLGWRAFRAAV